MGWCFWWASSSPFFLILFLTFFLPIRFIKKYLLFNIVTVRDGEYGLKKEAFAGLDIRNANNGRRPITESCTWSCGAGLWAGNTRGLSPRRPAAAAGTEPRRRGGQRREEPKPAPVPVGVTGHQTQRPRGQVGPPGAHPAHPSSPLDPGGERWPIFRTAETWLITQPLSAQCRGAHETGSPELWGSTATP